MRFKIYLSKRTRQSLFSKWHAYEDFKDLTIKTASYKILCYKAFNTAKYPNCHGSQRGLVSMVYKFFDKISALTCGASKNENLTNQSPLDLAEELRKPIIKKFENGKVYSPFIDNIWGNDLADMPLISKFNKEFRFLLNTNIFPINTHRSFLWKIANVLQLLMLIRKS